MPYHTIPYHTIPTELVISWFYEITTLTFVLIPPWRLDSHGTSLGSTLRGWKMLKHCGSKWNLVGIYSIYPKMECWNSWKNIWKTPLKAMIQLLFCFSLDPGTEPLQIEPVHLDKANIFSGVKNLEPTAKLPKLLPIPKIEGLVLECQQNSRISGIPSGKLLHNWWENHHFQWINPLCPWPCSIAFCMFTRG